jgi:hypothetical protein
MSFASIGNEGWRDIRVAKEEAVAKTVPAKKARQGRRGLHVLIILIVGLLLALIVWFGVEFFGEAIQNTSAIHRNAANV